MESDRSGSLEEQIDELRARVNKLEEALRLQPLPPQSLLQQTPPPNAIPIPAPQPRDRSLESRIGSQWFNRIGILAVLIGMSWFLKLAIDNHWVGPLGRVAIGLVAGSGIIAWSEFFQRKGFAGFAYSLKAVGSGILYLSLWAAFSLFHIIPASVAFAAMIVVTAFNGFMASLQDAELLALYAIIGGFSTPLLLNSGQNQEISLFSYLLLLNLSILVLSVLRPWGRLLCAAFPGTAFFFINWWFEYYSDAQFAVTAVFTALFFLLFAFAPRFVRLQSEPTGQPTSWDRIVLVILPLANAAAGFTAFYSLLHKAQAVSAAPWLAVTFAVFYLLLLRLPSIGILRPAPPLLTDVHLTTAILFLTIAIPLKAHGRTLTIGWLVEGAALLWVASRARSLLMRVLALFCLALGLIALILVNHSAALTPVLNQRFAAYCVAIAVFACAGWVARHAQEKDEHGILPWPVFTAASVLVLNALILLAVGWEIHNYWWYIRWPGDMQLMRDYRMYAQFTYSAFFMLFGAILLAIGFLRRSSFIRWQALILLVVSIGKVFLGDVSSLTQGYRILSFLALGGLLLAISFIYQKDWIRLRRPES